GVLHRQWWSQKTPFPTCNTGLEDLRDNQSHSETPYRQRADGVRLQPPERESNVEDWSAGKIDKD
ncbi:unnamed protein product, partial [Ectocarpus sp. 4 AP-2014]